MDTLKQLLVDTDSFVSTCTLAAIRLFGMESLDWDPLILRDALQDELKTDRLPQKLFDKVNCGYSLIGTNGYPTHIEVFVPCNSLMANQPIDGETLGLDDPYTLAWGVWEYFRLTGDNTNTVQFATDVAVYGGEVLYEAGITSPPDWLSWVIFDDTKIKRLDSSLSDPTFYSARQVGLKENIRDMCNARDGALMTELANIDKLLPIKN